MHYITYNIKDSIVVNILENETVPSEGYALCKSVSYEPGDEFIYTIYIHDVDENGELVYHSDILNNPQAARLLAENAQLKQQLLDTEDALAELGNLIAEVLPNG